MTEELAEELPSWCNAVEGTFTKESPRTLSKTEFHEYCMLAIDKGNEHEMAFGAKGEAPMSQSTSNQTNPTKRNI
jgi:hypothetical protein